MLAAFILHNVGAPTTVKYTIKTTNWKKDKAQLRHIRRKVFIEEQNVPEELEWDEFDNSCIHILVTNNSNTPVACGRLKENGHIGRMAVLKEYRCTGIGTEILKEILNSAKKMNLNKVYLHAQTSAIPFYEKQGFVTYTDEFMDAGIPHKSMQKNPI